MSPGEYSFKGLAINACSIMCFITPVAIFVLGLDRRSTINLISADAIILFIVLLIPPWGWKKPHPYSDQAHLRGGR